MSRLTIIRDDETIILEEVNDFLLGRGNVDCAFFDSV